MLGGLLGLAVGVLPLGLPGFPVPPAAAQGIGTAPDPARPGSRLDRLISHIVPEIHLRNAHTKEEVRLRFFTLTGYDLDAIARINWILRDWREGETQQIDVRLFWGLAALRLAAMKDGHSGLIQANSGFRTQKTNRHLISLGYRAAPESLHLKARAVDLTMDGVPMEIVSDYARWLEIGGVGYYRRSNFVHIDSGEDRFWRS
jgi:uncharacterized protein YcbK (DUF882 family)